MTTATTKAAVVQAEREAGVPVVFWAVLAMAAVVRMPRVSMRLPWQHKRRFSPVQTFLSGRLYLTFDDENR
jgi:hypothetical protein